jgi:mannosyltransferase
LPLALGPMDAATSSTAAFFAPRLNWRVTPLRLVAVLTLLTIVIRLTGLTSRPMWLDEAFSAWFSAQSFHYLWHVLPTYEAHPPFYYSLLKLWRMVFGGDAVALRSISVLFGVLTIPVVIAAAREHEKLCPTGRPMLRAGLAGFLAACSPMLVILEQEPRPYPLLILVYTVAILGLLRLIRQFGDGAAGDWRSWAMIGAGTEITLWSHSLGILYALCLGLALLPAWLRKPMSRDRLIRGMVVASAVALAYLPCLLLIASRTHDWGTNWLHWDTGMLLQLLVLYTVPVEALTIGSAVAALAMVLLIKRALSSTYASEGWNADRSMLLLWLGPPMLAALISAFFIPVFLARTLSGTLVPAYLMIGGAIARSDDARERRMITAAICITLLPCALAVALRPSSERWDLLSAYLSRNVGPNDQVWLYPADSALPLDAVGRPIPGRMRPIPEPFPTLGFKGPIRAGWPATVSLTPAQAATFANDPAIRGVPVIWLVTRQSGIFDPDNDVPAALQRVRKAGPIEEWGYISATPYRRR